MQHTPPIGSILQPHERRDAIHIAVAPVIAARALTPGQHIGLTADGKASTEAGIKIGIVDPFLSRNVNAGERFFLFLYPQTVTSLRHEWTHPAFTSTEEKDRSELWLRTFVARSDCPDYETVIAAASGERIPVIDEAYGPEPYVNDGEYLIFHGRDAHASIPPEFWTNLEIVTGKQIPTDKRATAFSCSC
jgi:hypothetical protein